MSKANVKRCASCNAIVLPHSWYRLASGILLCGKCYFESAVHLALHPSEIV